MNNKILIIHKSKLKDYRFDSLNDFLGLNLIDKDIILAGGAIRSFLRKGEENISDYDLFFKDLRLVPWVREKLLKAGAKLVFECPKGKLFTYKFDDIPIEEDVFEAGMKIQLICEFDYDSPISIISNFDFGAAMGAFDGENLFISTKMIEDVISRKLSLNILSYPVATLKRIIKYNRKGYNINNIAIDFVNELINSVIHGKIYSEEELRVYID